MALHEHELGDAFIMPKLDEYMQIAEAAEYLGICPNTLRNGVLCDEIPDPPRGPRASDLNGTTRK
jgi:hypothetical protein